MFFFIYFSFSRVHFCLIYLSTFVESMWITAGFFVVSYFMIKNKIYKWMRVRVMELSCDISYHYQRGGNTASLCTRSTINQTNNKWNAFQFIVVLIQSKWSTRKWAQHRCQCNARRLTILQITFTVFQRSYSSSPASRWKTILDTFNRCTLCGSHGIAVVCVRRNERRLVRRTAKIFWLCVESRSAESVRFQFNECFSLLCSFCRNSKFIFFFWLRSRFFTRTCGTTFHRVRPNKSLTTCNIINE